MKTIAIMQPTYLPWMGYFDMMDRVDEFVILDTVQFARHSWQHRNRVKGPAGEHTLVVPVRRSGLATTIVEAQVADRGAVSRHLTTIRQFYRKAAAVDVLDGDIAAILSAPPELLCDLDMRLIEALRAALGIETPLVRSSTLAVDGAKDRLVLSICRARHADVYLATPGSRTYMEAGGAFLGAEVAVRYHQYVCVPYPQLHGPFLTHLSALDLLLCTGREARRHLLAGRVPDA